MSTKSKRRYKKNKESEKQEDKEKQNKRLEQIKLVKEYLNLDLSESSAATQLKFKTYMELLNQSLDLKKDENNKEKLINILTDINSKILNSKNEIIKNKYELIPLEKEKNEAKEIFLFSFLLFLILFSFLIILFSIILLFI